MAYFSLLVYLTFRLRVRSDAAAPELPASLRRWAFIAVAAVYAQIVLGAVVRHTGAALQCIDIPLCGGRLWPEGTLAQIHMLHRFGAVVAGLLVLGSAGVVAWRGRGRVRLLAAGVLVTLAAQIALGIYSVLTFIAVPVVVAHLAVGALLLGLCLRLALALGRVPEARSVDVVPAWRDAPVGS
jgi:cytochrome c oxidase assembly protein subunit 15